LTGESAASMTSDDITRESRIARARGSSAEGPPPLDLDELLRWRRIRVEALEGRARSLSSDMSNLGTRVRCDRAVGTHSITICVPRSGTAALGSSCRARCSMRGWYLSLGMDRAVGRILPR
jgi:hypothetical protein